VSGILLIAGYDRAPHAIAVAEGMRRAGCSVDQIIIAYPLTIARARAILRRHGAAAVLRYLRGERSEQVRSPLRAYIEAQGIVDISLSAWARRFGIPCTRVGDINGERAVRCIQHQRPQLTLYTGGGILRRPVIEAAGRRILNAHSGPLPVIRGMNACEWSLLLGEPLSVTLHLVDEGVDTGAIIAKRRMAVRQGDTVEMLRQKCIVAGIQLMVEHAARAVAGELSLAKEADAASQRQSFVMAPALRELLAQRLPELIERQGRIG